MIRGVSPNRDNAGNLPGTESALHHRFLSERCIDFRPDVVNGFRSCDCTATGYDAMAAAATLAAGDFAWLTDESSEGDWSLPSKEENLLKNYMYSENTSAKRQPDHLIFRHLPELASL